MVRNGATGFHSRIIASALIAFAPKRCPALARSVSRSFRFDPDAAGPCFVACRDRKTAEQFCADYASERASEQILKANRAKLLSGLQER